MTKKIGRNDLCPCGSGKKFKQCCQPVSQNAHQPIKPSIQQITAALRAALLQQHAGHSSRAEVICQQVLQVAPNNPDALHLLGTITLQSGRIEDAIRLISRAIKLAPPNPEYYNNLGFAFHERGDLPIAEKHYRKALSIKPDYVNAHYNLHALLLNSKDHAASISCLRQVIALNPSDIDAHFMLGVLLDCSGNIEPANMEFGIVEKGTNLHRARLDAWRHLKSAAPRLPQITGSMIQTFRLAFEAAPKNGLVLEFGVRFGNTIHQIAVLAHQQVHGFDSFEGLPEEWHHEAKGSYTTKGQIPPVPKNVSLHVGWFDDTLPIFLQGHQGPVRLINVDCDIYSSTKTVLDLLAPRIISGTVIVFDEYIGNEHWREDEFKAFQEAVAKYGWSYDYLCFSTFTKQVAVQIREV